jgi:hypothetical protein
MAPHIFGSSLSAQARYAAGTREILECWFDKRPIREEYLIVRAMQPAVRKRRRSSGSGKRAGPRSSTVNLAGLPKGQISVWRMAKKLRAETKGEEMEYVKFGKTGLGVSRLCIGCMTYGIPNRGPHPWTLDEEKSRPLIRKALDLGIYSEA